METIPFKQVETVSNEYVLGLLLVVGLVAVISIVFVKYLKQKGIILLKNKSTSIVTVVEKKQISPSTQTYILEINSKRYLMTESNKNIDLIELNKFNLKPDCKEELSTSETSNGYGE